MGSVDTASVERLAGWTSIAALPAARALVMAVGFALALAGCSTPPPGTPPPAPVTTVIPPTAHVDLTSSTFAIDVFQGVPGNAADDLTNKIVEVGKREGIVFVVRLGAATTYRVRGYLTAIGNTTSTTVVYVYDILDSNGNRVFRFTGQEPSDGTSADPWAAVTSDTMSIIAERTVASIKAWLARGIH